MSDILLVEDKESLRHVIRLTLENAGYTVTESADARAAGDADVRRSGARSFVTKEALPDVAIRELFRRHGDDLGGAHG